MPRRHHHPYPGWLGGLLVGLWREGDRVVENFPGKKGPGRDGKSSSVTIAPFPGLSPSLCGLPKKPGMKYPSQLFPSPKLVISLPGGGGYFPFSQAAPVYIPRYSIFSSRVPSAYGWPLDPGRKGNFPFPFFIFFQGKSGSSPLFFIFPSFVSCL